MQLESIQQSNSEALTDVELNTATKSFLCRQKDVPFPLEWHFFANRPLSKLA